jgi:hypothetical protein
VREDVTRFFANLGEQVLLVAMSFVSIIVYMLGALTLILFSTDISDIQVKGAPSCGWPIKRLPLNTCHIFLPDGQVIGLGGITMGTIVAFSSYIGRYLLKPNLLPPF